MGDPSTDIWRVSRSKRSLQMETIILKYIMNTITREDLRRMKIENVVRKNKILCQLHQR